MLCLIAASIASSSAEERSDGSRGTLSGPSVGRSSRFFRMCSRADRDQRVRSGTGPLASLSNVWKLRTAIIVAMAKANDMSIANSFGFEGKAARTARTIEVARAARDRLTHYKTGAGSSRKPLPID